MEMVGFHSSSTDQPIVIAILGNHQFPCQKMDMSSTCGGQRPQISSKSLYLWYRDPK